MAVGNWRVASVVTVALAGSGAMAQTASPVVRQAAAFDGGEVRYDGTYYDYRDAEARKAMTLWVPPGDQAVRGVLFHGNPGGGGGDTREIAHDARLQEYAARWHFGIIGVTWFPSSLVAQDRCQTFLSVLQDWAKLGDHPELATVPVIARGSSNAGGTAFNWVRYAPDRVIAATPNVATLTPPYPDQAGLGVPMLAHIGPYDDFFPLGLKEMAEAFVELRPRGAAWAWTAEQGKKHEIGAIDGIDYAYYEAVIPRRLPQAPGERGAAVTLRPIDLADGWLADTGTWRQRGGGLTSIAPAPAYKGDADLSVWLPDAATAHLYRAISSYGPVINLSAENVQSAANTQASGALLRGVGSTVIEPGAAIRLRAEMPQALAAWRRVEFYDGASLIAAVGRDEAADGVATAGFTVDGSRRVYSLHALAHMPDGSLRTSRPMSFFVRDPAVYAALQRQRAARVVLAPSTRPAWGAAASTAGAPAITTDARSLPAIPLSSDAERGMAEGHADWTTAMAGATPVTIGARHAADGATAADRPAADVRAAYSRAGLYLLFVAAGETSPTTIRVDFHLSRDAAEVLHDARPHREKFTAVQYMLPVRGRQIALSIAEGGQVTMNLPDPWHIAFGAMSQAEATQAGLSIHRRPGTLGVFMPWRLVGSGAGDAQPAAGTRLGTVIGVDGAWDGAKLRWPAGLDPWQTPGERPAGQALQPFGDIVLVP